MRITYIITIYNKAKYLKNVITHLAKITGDFDREFIFVNDGSTDDSLKILNEYSNILQNVTILNQENQGVSTALNHGLAITTGDYIQFVDGDDIITADSTTTLISLMTKYDVDVAYGFLGKYQEVNGELLFSENKRVNHEEVLIEDPIKAILLGKISGVRSIGASKSMISRKILNQVKGCDENVRTQDVSLSLRCGLFSKFALIKSTVGYEENTRDPNKLSYNKNNETYNAIHAMRNFIAQQIDSGNDVFIKKYQHLFYKSISSMLFKVEKTPQNFIRYFRSKYCPLRLLQNYTMSPNELLTFADTALKQNIQR